MKYRESENQFLRTSVVYNVNQVRKLKDENSARKLRTLRLKMKDHTQKIAQKDNQIKQLKSDVQKREKDLELKTQELQHLAEVFIATKTEVENQNNSLKPVETRVSDEQAEPNTQVVVQDSSQTKKTKSQRRRDRKRQNKLKRKIKSKILYQTENQANFVDIESSGENVSISYMKYCKPFLLRIQNDDTSMMFQCSVCTKDFALSKRIKFDPCAHGACNKCATQLSDCHICGSSIASKSKQFT